MAATTAATAEVVPEERAGYSVDSGQESNGGAAFGPMRPDEDGDGDEDVCSASLGKLIAKSELHAARAEFK